MMITSMHRIFNSIRSSNASYKRINALLCSVLLLVACSFAPPSQVAASATETETGQEVMPIEQNEFLGYLPAVMSNTEPQTCSQSSFGTMLIHQDNDDWITPADVMIDANQHLGVKGLVVTGAPSDYVKENWYGNLPGWTRSFTRGTYEELIPIHSTATTFGMQDMYECIGYGPESAHLAGEEALDPFVWVPRAEEVAEAAGKCLIYGPAVLDYELMATPAGSSQPDEAMLADLIARVSPHVDVWMIQLAKYQRWTDAGHDEFGNPFTMDDFVNWVSWWVSIIKQANPKAEVWTQLGIGVYDPIQQSCAPPQPPAYILQYREGLIEAGVDGVFVMPSQPCQDSSDPQDHEYYLQSLSSLQQALNLACGE